MDLEIKKYLFDILESIDSIEKYLGDKLDFKKYASDKMLRRAIEREFEIIGEAMMQLDNISPQTAEQISQHRSIIGFRHVLVHGYSNLDPNTVWNVVETKISTLLEQAKKLLRD